MMHEYRLVDEELEKARAGATMQVRAVASLWFYAVLHLVAEKVYQMS